MTINNGVDLKVVQAINMPDSVVALNVFYFNCDFQTAQDEQDVLDAAESWIEAIYATVDDVISDECTAGEMTAYTYDTVLDQWDLIGAATPTITFADVGSMLPHGVCMMVRAYTTNPRTIGRKYIPGLTEAQSDDGAWVAGALTAGAAFGDAWDNNAVIDANNRLESGVFSTKVDSVYELNDTEVVLANPAYQRRRRPGVGI